MKKNLPVTQHAIILDDNKYLLTTTNHKGIITYCNEEFISVSGFEESELISKNHNVVRHPDMPPEAFKDLWSHLKNRYNWMNLVKNRAQNGDHYWVDAFVSPVVDEQGQVEYQSVRTKPTDEQVERAESLYGMMNKGKLPFSMKIQRPGIMAEITFILIISMFLSGLTNFLTPDWVAPVAKWALTYGVLFFAFLGMGRSYLKPLAQLIRESRSQYDNPISRHVYAGRQGDIGQLITLNKLRGSEIKALAARMEDVAYGLKKSNSELDREMEKNHQEMASQHNETDQAATAINELVSSFEEVARASQQAAELTREVRQGADENGQRMTQTTKAFAELVTDIDHAGVVVRELVDNSNNISTAVDMIQEIAEQTNLLALNAAIEAARAGDQGRGFAVVADEVRSLAKRTHASTEDIQKIITSLRNSANESMQAMTTAQKKVNDTSSQIETASIALFRVTEDMDKMTDVSVQVSSATEEQLAVVNEVNRSIVSIRDASTAVLETEEDIKNHVSRGVEIANAAAGLARYFWNR